MRRRLKFKIRAEDPDNRPPVPNRRPMVKLLIERGVLAHAALAPEQAAQNAEED
jgi:hypothetical protein